MTSHTKTKNIRVTMPFHKVATAVFLLVITLCLEGKAADPNNFYTNVICGYQGWYNTTSPASVYVPPSVPGENLWDHWSENNATPSNTLNGSGYDNVLFEQFPDLSGYSTSSLTTCGLNVLGDGRMPNLYTEYRNTVIDNQFSLMHQYGIDGVAVQRFFGLTVSPYPATYSRYNKILQNVRTSAENYQRVFCVMYDVSGTNPNVGSAWVQDVENDWQNNVVNALGSTSSPWYAKQSGQPVVAFYGLGATTCRGTASDCQSLINWFHGRGVYIYNIAPPDWNTLSGQTRSDFLPIFNQFDLLGSWPLNFNATGSLFQGDLQQRNSVGKTYMPTLWAGFSAYNFKPAYTPANVYPRNSGAAFWAQAAQVRNLGIRGAYVAMLDELGEGTGMLPFADSSLSIPISHYFLTTSADGSYCSSDYYMRLIGAASSMINGSAAYTTTIPISPYNGPVWYRTGFEKNYDAIPTNIVQVNLANVPTGYGGTGSPVCAENNGPSSSGGAWSMLMNGRGTVGSASYNYYKIQGGLSVPVSAGTVLKFTKLTDDAGALNVSVDLKFSDGTYLRNSGALDQNGASMHPGTAKGTVGQWTATHCVLGQWVSGKTISQILIGYDSASSSGDYQSHIDNLVITDDETR